MNTNYDNMGRVASKSNPFMAGGSPSYSTSYSYDTLGRATTVTLPDSQTVTTSYSGNSVTATDQVNRKMQRVTDGLGRLVTVNEQDSSGNLTQATNYTYNYLNDLTQMDQGGQLRKSKYDAMSRLLYEKIPEQTASINDGSGTYWTSKYTYTDFNALATRTDARGVVTTYSYDSLHRLTELTYNTVSGVTTAPTVIFLYDTDRNYSTIATGKLLRVNVGSDYQERYTFDGDYRIASGVRTVGTRSYTTSYSYNEASQITQLTHPSGLPIAFTHDSTGRLSGLQNVSTQANYLSSVSYNIVAQVMSDTLGNGVTEQFGYDAARMQITSQKAGSASPYTNRMDLTYSYSASSGQMGVGSTAGNVGQLMSVTGTINSTTESANYTYDNYTRLVTSSQSSNGSSAQRRFAYDRWGNRTGVWDATSGGNQIQSISLQQSGGVPTNRLTSETHLTSGGQDGGSSVTLNYSYDASGNVTNDGVHSYTYDSENRLVSVDSGTTATYAYDHQNRRYKKTVGSTVTHYVWEGEQVLAEHNGSTGAVLVDYIYSGHRILAKVASGTTSYLLSDGLSQRLTLDTGSNVVGRQAHLPFGEDFGESGTQEKHHLASYERDAESVTDYAVNRQYTQNVGRFNSVDAYSGSYDISNPQSLNRYAYVENDPINGFDPLGLLKAICTIKISGTITRYETYYFVSATISSVCKLVLDAMDGKGDGLGGGQTTKNLTPKDSAKAFLDKYKACEDAINAAAKAGGFEDIRSILKNLKFVRDDDLSAETMAMTLRDLKFPAWLTENELNSTLFSHIGGDKPKDIALTNPANHTIYLSSLWDFHSIIPIDPTIVHEALHDLFQGGHKTIAEKLNLSTAGTDREISDRIDTYLESGCKK